MNLTLATCQFPIDADIRRNLAWVTRQMKEARRRGAHLVHFPECCLSGYAGVEFKSFAKFDWELLRESVEQVQDLARELKLWVVLGSAHRLSDGNRPHNSLYVIDDRGRVRDRYDKLFCTGDPRAKTAVDDLAHYNSGDHFVTFDVRGIRCGLQICHDFRYQELYRELKRRRVRLVLHSYHNGHTTKARLARSGNIWGVIVPPTMQTYAANNYMWISANNTSAKESSWPSFVVRPDGMIISRLQNNRPGMLVTKIDTNQKLYDASSAWRDRAMQGIYHSGTLVKNDRRSRDRRVI
jgi:predicted amidohydrolase